MSDPSTWSGEVRACLNRRAALLEAGPDELARVCQENLRESEPRLLAWKTGPGYCESNEGGDPIFPLGVKDVIDVAGFPTGAGSVSRRFAPAVDVDAEVVARLREAGYLPVGKTHTTEFAYTDPPPTSNPFDRNRSPGGSSSGSAAAVGAAQVPVAIGTQTAGSVCRPAAFCGVYAFKPSTGATSPHGVTPFAPSFDTVGAYGLRLRWAIDVAMVMLGHGEHRCRDSDAGLNDLPASSRLTIGVIDDPYFQDVSPDIGDNLRDVVGCLQAEGHIRRPLTLGINFNALRGNHLLMMQFEAFQAHRELLQRPEEVGPAWLSLLKTGSQLTVGNYEAARAYVERARREIAERIAEVDVVLTSPAFNAAPLGLQSTGNAGLIIPWTCAGSPLTVLPTGLDRDGVPRAVMLAGHAGEDLRHARFSLRVGELLASRGWCIDSNYRPQSV